MTYVKLIQIWHPCEGLYMIWCVIFSAVTSDVESASGEPEGQVLPTLSDEDDDDEIRKSNRE